MQSRCTRWGNVTQKLMEVPFVPEVGGRRASFLRVTWNPASLTINTTKLNLVLFPPFILSQCMHCLQVNSSSQGCVNPI